MVTDDWIRAHWPGGDEMPLTADSPTYYGRAATPRPTPLSQRPPDLPDFERPPLTEVVLAVHLDPLPALRAAHLGLLWTEFRGEYPSVEEHPPIETPEEQFGPAVGPQFQIQLLGPPPVPRFWFISADGTRLLQLQQDRFIHNWRRLTPDTAYPRYEALRESFETHFQAFARFLDENRLGTATIRQAEVNYGNHLIPGEGWSEQGELERVVRMWSPTYEPGLLEGRPEDIRLAQRHLIADEGGPYARLYVAVEPVVGGALVLNLTVRGRPRSNHLKGTLDFFDMGRKRIVNAFTAVTTAEMHQAWGRIK